ncbi:hypothetical protein ACNKHX_19355 [Shigella flexneri]
MPAGAFEIKPSGPLFQQRRFRVTIEESDGTNVALSSLIFITHDAATLGI